MTGLDRTFGPRSHEARRVLRDLELLKAAADVFARNGYPSATIQQVADELGILKGSVYHYINTKEDLLLRLLEQVHEDVDALIVDTVALSDVSALQRIEHYIRASLNYNLSNLTKITVYYDNFDHLSEANRKRIVARRRTHEQFVVDLVIAGQGEGVIDKGGDARALAYSIFATIIWPYRWFRPRSRVRAADVVETGVRFAMSGVTASY